MSTSPLILNLRLDSNFDVVWDPTAQLTNLQAVEQAILTRIKLFQGEWWENLNEGTPMFQQILAQRMTPKKQQLAAQALTSRILGTPYVTGVNNVSFAFNSITRQFTYSAIAQTSFGTVTVNFSPGSAAGVVEQV